MFASPALSHIPFSSSRRLFAGNDTPAVAQRGISTPINSLDAFNVHDALLFDSLGQTQPTAENQHRKRRLDALFEDIFIPDETDHVQKKLKNEEERDENVIRMILEARVRNQSRMESTKEVQLLKIQEMDTFRRKNLSKSVPHWPFTALIRTDQERIYVRTHSEEFESKELEEIKLLKAGEFSILGHQKSKIWEGAREILDKRLNEAENSTIPQIQEV